MKFAVVALMIAAASPSLAQSRVSIELGGMVSSYDVAAPASSSVARGAITLPSTGTGGNAATGGNGAVAGGAPTQAIAAVEVRPTVTLDSGFLMGVGFRAGQAGLSDTGATLIGGDLAFGYARRFGPFLPFIKGMLGFNNYDFGGATPSHQTDFRVDAVLGSRLYLTQRFYLAASAFAGYGDRYGGAVSVGGDVVQVFQRGVMP